jgi:hypothetical protein
VRGIQGEQSAEWIANCLRHTAIPAKEVGAQLIEFLESSSSFWSKLENREYLVSAFIAIFDRMPCPPSELKTMAARIKNSFPSTKSMAWISKLLEH